MAADPTIPDTTGGSAGYVVVPAPDDTTESTWIGDISAKTKAMILDWKETKISYETMVSERSEFGIPLISNGWSQFQDDQYQLTNWTVVTLAKYASEIDEGVRKVAYDSLGDQIVMLGDAGDIQVTYKDGVLNVKTGDKSVGVDSSGFMGYAVPPAVIAIIVVAAAATAIVGIVAISQVMRDYIRRVVQKDATEHEQKVADDLIKGGVDPSKAHETAAMDTSEIIKALESKARADAEADEKSGVGQIASTVKTVAWVALGVAVVGAALYFGAPLLQRSMAESGGAPRLARQNPRAEQENPRRRHIGTTGDVNMFDYDAGVVYDMGQGPMWQWWYWRDESGEPNRAEVYRASVPDDVFAYHDWAKAKDVARTTGQDEIELLEMGRSKNVMARVYALEAISEHYGPHNLDESPTIETRSELKKRFGKVDPGKLTGKRNPARGKAVAAHGGYVWATTYEVVTEESAAEGEAEEQGWEDEYEDNAPERSLADLLQNIPSYSWLEWSSMPPGPGSWISDEANQDYSSGDYTSHSLHIKHADGTDLTQQEINFIDKKIFGGKNTKARR